MPTDFSASGAIPFHPLAELFPLLEGREFDDLVTDIKTHGLIEPIILYEDKILDGRNRYRACVEAGVTPRFRIAVRLPERSNPARPLITDPVAYVISANICRRHLTADQKRDLIAKLIKATPEKSDRQIAETVKASPTTVGTVRAKMEATGDVSKLDTRTDTRGRQQPAKRKRPITNQKKYLEQINTIAAAGGDPMSIFDHQEQPAPSTEDNLTTRITTKTDTAEASASTKVRRKKRPVPRDAIAHLAAQLVATNPVIARSLHDLLWRDDRYAEVLVQELARELGLEDMETNGDEVAPDDEENEDEPDAIEAPTPSASSPAPNSMADDDLEIPECLRRSAS